MSESTLREQMHSAIQGTNTDEDEVQGAILVGWVVCAEWLGTDGRKWMSRLTDDNATSWGTRGLLHEALFNWPDGNDE